MEGHMGKLFVISKISKNVNLSTGLVIQEKDVGIFRHLP